MKMVFFCPKCGARFEAPGALAGKHAVCKRCRGPLTIPSSAQSGVAGGNFRLQPAQESVVARPVTAAAVASAPARPRNWIEAVTSQVALQPLSVAAAPAVKKIAPSALDGPSFPGLYRVASAPSLPAVSSPSGRPGRPAGALTRAYRGQIGGLQGLLRWVSESSYLLSVPFLVLLVFGAVVHNHALAMLGATLVVLLNIGRLVAGIANLALIPFRDGLIQGILFLIPPISIFYCMANWKRVKKPLKRIIEPALTLAAVVAAFTFIPWLGGRLPEGDVKAQLTSGVQELRSGIENEMGNLPGKIQRLPQKAQELFKKGVEDAQKQPDEPQPPAAAPANPAPAGPLEQLRGVADQLKAIRQENP